MTRIVIYFFILLLCEYSRSLFDLDIEPNKKNNNPVGHGVSKEDIKNEKTEDHKIPEIDIGAGKLHDKKDQHISASGSVITSKTVANTSTSSIKTKAVSANSTAEIESGVFMRGVFVFVGITMLFIIYIAFKTFRRGNKANALIKKYGVRTRRSDVEMEPLPLDEDEEDETVFDLGNVHNARNQR